MTCQAVILLLLQQCYMPRLFLFLALLLAVDLLLSLLLIPSLETKAEFHYSGRRQVRSRF